MRNLLDFSEAPILKSKLYTGTNGKKIGVLYNGEEWLLKFSSLAKQNPNVHYSNSCISEDISCRIFKSLGIKAQETLLGVYEDKVVVACKDFTEKESKIFRDFASLKNTTIDSDSSGYSTELEEVLDTIHDQQIYDPAELEKFFWDQFVIDAFLGNFDRHNGNWGFLFDRETSNCEIAPVFDCGSCLYAQTDDKQISNILSSTAEIEKRIYKYPNSAIKLNDVKINYYQFLATTNNKKCLDSLEKVINNIDFTRIFEIIDETPLISDMRKEFYKTMLVSRKEKLLDKAMNRNKSMNRDDKEMEI